MIPLIDHVTTGDHRIVLPVVDSEHLVGIVTETDWLNYFIRMLETQT